MQNEYDVVYLPRARLDLSEMIHYTLNDLNAPVAAEHFVDSLDEKVGILYDQSYSGATYKGNHKFDCDYRMIFVGNYTVFYVIERRLVEIHRIIYSARSMDDLI